MDHLAAAPLRVLVIEDDEDDYVLAEAMMLAAPSARFLPSWRRSAAEGLAALAEPGWAIALIDYYLGTITGTALIRQARAQGCRIPLLLRTGKQNPDLGDCGADGWLCKRNFDPAAFERDLLAALARNPQP